VTKPKAGNVAHQAEARGRRLRPWFRSPRWSSSTRPWRSCERKPPSCWV